MCKYNEHRTPATGAELDSCRRVGRPNGSRQSIPALPDPMTGIYPDPGRNGTTKLKPPAMH